MDTLILDTTGEDFGKHAYSQLAEFQVEAEVKEVKLVDAPGVISRTEAESFLVICDTDQKFSELVVDKILDLEIDKGIIEKVLLDSSKQSQEIYGRTGRRESGEAAEKLANKIR